MRTIPSQVSDGLTNGYTAFWVVKIEAIDLDDNSAVTYYWTTASKNRTGDTFTLKWDADTTVTPDATMIAARDLISKEEYDGIGAMESGADLYAGGGVATISDLAIDILNQERFDETIIQANIFFENRAITIYFGFIPDGAAQTVIVSTQMLKRWAGVIEDVHDFDYQTFKLRCIDGSIQRHKDIPGTIITSTNFANAPKESVGQPLPIVYGAFYSNESNERDNETVSPAPSIKVDDTTQEFYIAGHALHTISGIFAYRAEYNLFGLLTGPDTTNTAAEASFQWAPGTTIIATFRQIPRVKTTDTSADVDETNAIDTSLTSAVSLGNNKLLYQQLDYPTDIGTLVDSIGGAAICALRVVLGAITTLKEGTIKYYDNIAGWTDLHSITDVDASSTLSHNTSTTGMTWSDFRQYKFGVTSAATAGTIDVAHLVIEWYVKLYDLTSPQGFKLLPGLPRREGGERGYRWR